MKTWKFLTGTLFVLFLCLHFAACSEDDYTTPTADELVGTTWTGKDSSSMYNQVIIITKSGLKFVTRGENGQIISEEPMDYTYNEEDGSFHAWSESFEISGTINNSYMSITTSGGEHITLDKE